MGVTSSIHHWFSRPQLIWTLPWVEGGTVTAAIEPMGELFNIASTTSNWEKLKGYSKIRGNLHIKIEQNASPFHFGAINVSWAPLTTEQGNSTPGSLSYDAFNSFSGASLSSYGPTVTTGTSTLMRATQRMNGYLYPQDENSLEFNIPFLYPKEYIELRAIPDAGSSFASNSRELKEYGTLYMQTVVPLLVAQSLTGGLATINVYAWLTEVELEGPSYVLTSGVVSAAGTAMTSFKDVPIIGGYLAKAGAISKASAKVMSLLGMSNYPNESASSQMSLNILPALTAPDIDSQARYLGLASHSGLTMSPNDCETDELEIEQFGKSPVYLGLVNWTISVGKGTHLFDANVSPEYYSLAALAGSAAGASYAVTTTPICHISSLFLQWRGKVKYHFTAIASQYHRGRLRIFHDSSIRVPTGAPKEGYVFSKIWDITETKNFEFEVPFTASTQMLKLYHPQFSTLSTGSANYTCLGETPTLLTLDPRAHNGSVSLQVLNQLLGPNAVGVKIICSVSYSDIEFAEPCIPGSFINTTSVQPGSMGISQLTLGHDYITTSAVPTDHKPFDAHIYNGEKVKSLRTLLHRSADYAVLSGPRVDLPVAALGGELNSRLTMPREPLSPGEHSYRSTLPVSDGGAVHFANNLHVTTVITGSNNAGYNYVAMTPYAFLKGMFAGYRGSFRWKFVPESPDTLQWTSGFNPNIGLAISLSVTRSHKYTGGTSWAATTAGAGISPSVAARDMLGNPMTRGYHAFEGAEFNTSTYGGAITIDAPQYSRFKFLPTNDVLRSFSRDTAPVASLGSVAGVDGVYEIASDSLDVDCKFLNPLAWTNLTSTILAAPKIRTYSSCGTDFSFVGFVNTPVVFVRAALPNPNPL